MININDIREQSNILRFSMFPRLDGENDIVIKEQEMKKSDFEIWTLKSVDEFIKKNPSTKEITSSMFFSRPGMPDPNGLLSNEIFGLTKQERSGIMGYISLNDYFLDPLCYKKLVRLNAKFRNIVHGTKSYIINDAGELVESENGGTGLSWLKKNIDSIKLAKLDMSIKVERNVDFIEANKKIMWIDKYLVIPAFYRDVDNSGEGKVAVGEINNLYASLISSCRGIKETADYGFSAAESIKGRIQELLLAIYDCIIGNNNNMTEGATGLSKKLGYFKRAGEAKTSNFGSRLVLSAPNMAVEYIDDVMVDIKHAAVPLASLLANYYPFIVNWMRHFFDNQFGTGTTIDVINKQGKVVQAHVEEPLIQFSDDVIKEEIHRFIEGWSDRFRPVMIKTEEFKEPMAYRFKAEQYDLRQPDKVETGEAPIINRRITWCDLFFIAACDICEDKPIFITRYPIDSCYNQFGALIKVKSTKDTLPIYYRGKHYQFYPDIKEEDINTDTSNRFSDTMWISNLMLKAIGGDYDGDTVSTKAPFTSEAQDELVDFIKSKANLIGFDGKCIRASTNESIQSIYNLTRTLPATKLTPTEDIYK